MPYCQECGKKVAANAKFCRNCGASLAEEPEAVAPVVSPPVPAPEKPKPEPRQKPKPKTRPEPRSSPEPKPEPVPARTCVSCGKPVGPDEEVCVTCASARAETLREPVQEPVSIPEPVPEPLHSEVCTSCGSPLGPGEKVCGVCGAAVSMIPASVSAPLPPQETSPDSAPVFVLNESPEGRECRVCGNVIGPGDKFCGKCCARVIEDQPGARERVPAPEPLVSPGPQPAITTPAPAPFPAEQPSRTCRSCGNTIKPGDKFCGRCCAKVVDNQPVVTTATPSAEAPPPLPSKSLPADILSPAPAPAELSGGRICRSCGAIINPGDKFCGKCCAKVVDNQPVPAAAAVPLASVMTTSPVCPSCGSPINGSEKFCGICGAEITIVPEPSPAPVPPSSMTPGTGAASGEQVIGVIGNVKKMKMLGASWDTYSIVITDQRMILARMTQEMINTAIREAQATAKTEGKGFLSQMMHQMSAMFRYSQRYLTLPPDQALAENKDNRGIGNRSITSIKMKPRESGSDGNYRELRILIEAHDGKFEFVIAEDERFTTLLKQVYGDKVHMPPGYLSAGGIRIKLF